MRVKTVRDHALSIVVGTNSLQYIKTAGKNQSIPILKKIVLAWRKRGGRRWARGAWRGRPRGRAPSHTGTGPGRRGTSGWTPGECARPGRPAPAATPQPESRRTSALQNSHKQTSQFFQTVKSN